jgi:O-antigen/teichoic acid export membrane protein
VLLPDFLRLWIGPEFAAESAWTGQVLAFSFIFRGAFVPYHGLFQGLGKPQYLTVIYLGSGLTILGLNLLLIPAFGLAGAGYAYLIALAWGFSGLLYAWKWIKQETPWRPLVRAVLFPSVLALVSLGWCATLLSVASELGWVGLVGLGAAFAGGTTALLAGADWLSGRRDSHAGTLLRAVLRLIKSSPGVRLAEAHFEGRT